LGPVADAAPSLLATSPALTGAGTIVGTVGYMSPEQVRGREADHRSDIFALGAILYELLSGQRAFTGDSAVETMNAILKEDPPELTRVNSAVTSTNRSCHNVVVESFHDQLPAWERLLAAERHVDHVVQGA